MEEYCRSDVDILRRGCGCFRRELINISGLDPLSEACIFAKACSKVWRKNHMPKKVLPSSHLKAILIKITTLSKL